MRRILALAFLILAIAIPAGLAGCGGDNSATTSAAEKSSGSTGKKEKDSDEGTKFTGTATRTETFCFNGKCNTCNTTDQVTLSLDDNKVKIEAAGPVLTFPSCAAETGVSNNEWTLQGTFSAGANNSESGSFTVSSCKGETVTAGKWQGSGNGAIDGGKTAKADLTCTGTDEASSKESDKSEWKNVVLSSS